MKSKSFSIRINPKIHPYQKAANPRLYSYSNVVKAKDRTKSFITFFSQRISIS